MLYSIYIQDQNERGVGLVYSQIKNIKDAEILACKLMDEMAKGISSYASDKLVLIVPHPSKSIRYDKEKAIELEQKHMVDNVGSYHPYKYGYSLELKTNKIRDSYECLKYELENLN